MLSLNQIKADFCLNLSQKFFSKTINIHKKSKYSAESWVPILFFGHFNPRKLFCLGWGSISQISNPHQIEPSYTSTTSYVFIFRHPQELLSNTPNGKSKIWHLENLKLRLKRLLTVFVRTPISCRKIFFWRIESYPGVMPGVQPRTIVRECGD